MAFYSNDPEGRPVLSAINAAQVAQQDADTRRAQQELMFLINVARNNIANREIDSNERVSNRRFQSEDYRTDRTADSANRGTDAALFQGLDANAINRMREQQRIVEGEQALRFGREQLENAIKLKTLENSGRLAEAQALANAQANFMLLQGGGIDPRLAETVAKVEVANKDAEDQARATAASALNAIKPTVRGYFNPARYFDGPLYGEGAFNAAVEKAGGTNKFYVLPDVNGRPTVVPKPTDKVDLAPILTQSRKNPAQLFKMGTNGMLQLNIPTNAPVAPPATNVPSASTNVVTPPAAAVEPKPRTNALGQVLLLSKDGVKTVADSMQEALEAIRLAGYRFAP